MFGISVSHAGRFYYRFHVGMSFRFRDVRNVTVAALRTGIGRISALGAGRLYRFRFVGMGKFFRYVGVIGITAHFADVLRISLARTGRFIDRFRKSMSRRFRIVIDVLITAILTEMRGIALVRAIALDYDTFKIVSRFVRVHARIGISAIVANVSDISLFGTCRLRFRFGIGMPLGFGVVVLVTFAAKTANVLRVTHFRAGCLNDMFVVFVRTDLGGIRRRARSDKYARQCHQHQRRQQKCMFVFQCSSFQAIFWLVPDILSFSAEVQVVSCLPPL